MRKWSLKSVARHVILPDDLELKVTSLANYNMKWEHNVIQGIILSLTSIFVTGKYFCVNLFAMQWKHFLYALPKVRVQACIIDTPFSSSRYLISFYRFHGIVDNADKYIDHHQGNHEVEASQHGLVKDGCTIAGLKINVQLYKGYCCSKGCGRGIQQISKGIRIGSSGQAKKACVCYYDNGDGNQAARHLFAC